MIIWTLLSDVRVVEWFTFGLGALCITIATLGAIQIARTPMPNDRLLLLTFATSSVSILVMARGLAPTILVPILLATNCFGFLLVSSTPVRRVVIGGSILTPILLYVADLIDPTMQITGGTLTVTSRLYAGEGVGTLYAAAPLVVPVLIGIFAISFTRVLENMESSGAQVELQRWRLRQLLPQGVGSMLTLSAGQLTRDQVMEKLSK